MEAAYSGLPYPTSAQLESLFKNGVPADAMAEPWPIKSAQVRFFNGGSFDFAREGHQSIIFLAEDCGEVIDLIAWQQKSGAVASWRGAAFCLGDTEHIFNPATYFADDALRIHRTPLDWLKASREGICIVRSGFCLLLSAYGSARLLCGRSLPSASQALGAGTEAHREISSRGICSMTDNVYRLRPLATEDEEALPPAFTEEALALRFAETHADDLRFVAAWGKWYIWTGTRWREDDTLKVFDYARKICRTASAECNRSNLASRIASRQTVAAIVSLARADRRLAATVEQWDTDPWLLNTPDGTIDLHTGAKRANRAQDYITKSTSVAPGGGCPLFLRFLSEITDDDTELQSFLQRVFGYSLTGSTREHALFFGYGTGRNGKSVLIDTVPASPMITTLSRR